MVDDIAQEGGYDLEEMYGLLLCQAACFGDVQTAEFCKNQGASLDHKDNRGKTPLWYAQNFAQHEMVNILRKWGAREGTFEKMSGMSPSGKPVASGSSGTLKVTYNNIIFFYKSTFSEYVEQGIEKEHIKRYLEKTVKKIVWGKECELKEMYGGLLFLAAIEGNIEAAKFCKDHGADPDYKDERGRTALWYARKEGINQMVEALQEWGAPGDTDGWWGKSSGRGGVGIDSFYELILSRGVKKGLSKENSVRAVEDFVQNKEYELQSTYGELLYLAAGQGNIEVAELCKDQGADLNYKDHSGKTPLQAAKKSKHSEMAKALKEWGAHESTFLDRFKFKSKPPSSLEGPSAQGKQRESVNK